MQPQSIKLAIVKLGAAWRWARQAGHVTKPFPSEGIRYPRGGDVAHFQTRTEIQQQLARGNVSGKEQQKLWERLYFTRDELDHFLGYVREHTTAPYLRSMITLACFTGMRRSELLRAQTQDIDLAAGVITIRERKRVHGANTTRRMPLSAQLQETLANWLANHPGTLHLFWYQPAERYHAEGTRVTESQAQAHWHAAIKESEWVQAKGFHVLRHSFISACASQGIDARVVQAWVGHMSS